MEFLLSVLIVLLAALLLALGMLMKHFSVMSKRGQSAAGVHFSKADIEHLLATGKTVAARKAALEWQRKEPRNTATLLLLAKAHFQLGELVEAKSVLEELVGFAPDMEYSARPYLSRINVSLGKSRPRAVE